MTHRAMQILSFSLASCICAPFVLLLALFALFAAFPNLRGASLAADLAFLGFYIVSGPIGLASVAVAATAVWFSFRTHQGSRSQFYVLLFYSAVLAGYVVYLAWWYGTGQRLDTP